MFNGKKAAQYIFFETVPSFILGLAVFVLMILMFQALRLTDFALVHGVEAKVIAQMIGYIVISMLPALFPMALLFGVIMTYGRLSQDSEIVAMKACGLHMGAILTPAIVLAALVAAISAQTSYSIAPWGNRQFEVIMSNISNSKASATIKEGTFSEGFFDMVVYASKVDSEKGLLQNIFIFDERNSTPITIIAKNGQIISNTINFKKNITLRLNDGNIHRQEASHTKIKFDSYDINLSDPGPSKEREKSPQSLTMNEITEKLSNKETNKELINYLLIEKHKRTSIAALCLIFALLGVALGTTTNKRQAKSGGIILSIGIIVGYWIFYITLEGMARQGKVHPAFAVWFPNLVFTLFGFYSLRKNWN